RRPRHHRGRHRHRGPHLLRAPGDRRGESENLHHGPAQQRDVESSLRRTARGASAVGCILDPGERALRPWRAWWLGEGRPAHPAAPDFPEVFALGDNAGTTNGKTASAVRDQAPVVAKNVRAVLSRTTAPAKYSGYGACPITIGGRKVFLAEADYS